MRQPTIEQGRWLRGRTDLLLKEKGILAKIKKIIIKNKIKYPKKI